MRAECAGTGMGHTSHSAWYLSSISRRKSLRWVPFGASAFVVIVRTEILKKHRRMVDGTQGCDLHTKHTIAVGKGCALDKESPQTGNTCTARAPLTSFWHPDTPQIAL